MAKLGRARTFALPGSSGARYCCERPPIALVAGLDSSNGNNSSTRRAAGCGAEPWYWLHLKSHIHHCSFPESLPAELIQNAPPIWRCGTTYICVASVSFACFPFRQVQQRSCHVCGLLLLAWQLSGYFQVRIPLHFNLCCSFCPLRMLECTMKFEPNTLV